VSEDLPTGWTRTRLGQLAARIQYGLTASAKASEDGPRFLRITDIQDARVDWASVPSCDSSGDDLSRYELLPGDIVFARTGATTGKSYLIRQCPPGAVFASYLIRVRPLGSIRSDFLKLFFQSPAYWQQIAGVAGNAHRTATPEIANLEVPVPPLNEQKRIVERVEATLADLNTSASA
jgi:type I restriction enzyme S subunit